ncbi:MAG: response regulator transcription factor [Solirubrobacteraceae bacterium]
MLVVDDDETLRRLLRRLIEGAGHDVLEAEDGTTALRMLWAERPDLLVLDIAMGGLTGWEVLERVREMSDLPVLMLSGKAGELEKVRALRSGADDYVTKPFARQELLARVEGLLRRRAEPAFVAGRYDDGLLTVDFARHEASIGGQVIELTALEFRLLSGFVQHPNQVLAPEQLLELAWGGAGHVAPTQVKLTVSRLRSKLRDAGAPPDLIETRRGAGYQFRPAPAAYG